MYKANYILEQKGIFEAGLGGGRGYSRILFFTGFHVQCFVLMLFSHAASNVADEDTDADEDTLPATCDTSGPP